jgi:protein O-mannosyl-transferase
LHLTRTRLSRKFENVSFDSAEALRKSIGQISGFVIPSANFAEAGVNAMGRREAPKRRQPEEKSAPRAESLLSPKQRTFALSLLLLALTFGVYHSVVHNAFVNYDDDKYILSVSQLRQPLGWGLLRWAFTTFTLSNWHPLTWLSLALDYQLFQASPAAVHLENVLIHAVSSVLLFLLLQKATKSTWRSVVVAALFVGHPLNVESVAWAAERKNVLSMLFFMIALYAYGRYATQRTIARYLAVFAAFALGLMAKPQIVTFPFVLLLWDVWPLGRWLRPGQSTRQVETSFSWLILEKIPLFLLSATCCVITLRAQTEGGAVGSLQEYPISVRLGNAVVGYVRYLGNVVWPSNLAVLYPYPTNPLPAWEITLAAIVLLTISVLVMLAWHRRYFAIGWFWFLGTLVPMIGLVQVGLASRADRYTYLPSIGLFFLAVWGVSDWARERRIPDAWPGVSAAAVLVLLCVVTLRQVSHWHNSETLWMHAIEVTPYNAVAEANLGSALAGDARGQDAVEHFRRAVAIDPGNSLAQFFIGLDEGRRGNAQAAVQHLKIASQRPSDNELTELIYANLGTAYRNLHEYAEARQSFAVALQLNPTDSGAGIGMGLIAQHEKNLPEAIRWYSQAMLGRPSAVACLLLAKAMEENNQLAESKSMYEKAGALTKDLNASERVVDQMLASVD